MIWDENNISGFIDGINYFNSPIDPATMEEFREKFYMILNVAMGGTLGSGQNPPNGTETWPQTMLVDWVRVYQAGAPPEPPPGPGPNELVNSSFESPDASGGDAFNGCGGDFAPGWGSFNCNAISSNLFTPGGDVKSPGALDGTQVLKQFGGDAGSFQDIPAGAGDRVDAQIFAMNWNGDNFNNIFLLQIFALDSNGDNISGGFTPFAQVSAGSDAIAGGSFDYTLAGTDGGNDSDWTQMDVSAVMPAGTASASIQLIHIEEASTPAVGSIFLDKASLTVTSDVPPLQNVVYVTERLLPARSIRWTISPSGTEKLRRG
jgi:hypothetical protein